MKTRQIINRASKTAAVAVMACFLGMAAQGAWVQVANVSALRAVDPSTLADGDMALLPGYYSDGDRGGGWFKWHASSTVTDDGGKYIIPNTNPTYGRWFRVFQAETYNVKMWGAKGDGVNNDTTAIQNAVNAAGVSELLFLQGTYLITNTIVFPSLLHLRGEGAFNNTIIRMQGDHDVLMTVNAQSALQGGRIDWEHNLLVENLALYCDTNSTAAGLVICQPGEINTIRNMFMCRGGYGIRCFGVGAPGLRVLNCTVMDAGVANVSIEGLLPNGTWLDGNGPVNITGLSGDHPDTNYSSTSASFVRIYKCGPTLSIYDFKAEGWYRNGLIYYEKDASGGPYIDQIGSVTIQGGTWNTITGPSDCDFVVLKCGPGSTQTASVTIHSPNLYGIRYLIRDDMTGRTIKPFAWGLVQTQARVPICYEGSNPWPDKTTNYPPRTRLVVGSDVRCDFVPTMTNAWYRVMYNWVYHLGGALDITSYMENTEVQVDVGPALANGAQINVTRPSKSNPTPYFQPRISKVRAGGYWDPVMQNNMGFVDIYVTQLPGDGENITLKHPLTSEFGDDGVTQLCVPRLITGPDIAPPGCTLNSCVTNSVIW